MDRFNLAKALDSVPKVLRTVRANKSVVLLTSDYALGISKYAKIEPANNSHILVWRK